MLSLEMCLKLKEAGWPQEHRVNLGHGYYNHKRLPNDGPMAMWSVDQWPIDGFVFLCAQPTLDELLEAIRVEWPKGGIEINGRPDRGWRATTYYKTLTDGSCPEVTGFPNPSEAAAALWLKLKQSKPQP